MLPGSYDGTVDGDGVGLLTWLIGEVSPAVAVTLDFILPLVVDGTTGCKFGSSDVLVGCGEADDGFVDVCSGIAAGLDDGDAGCAVGSAALVAIVVPAFMRAATLERAWGGS